MYPLRVIVVLSWFQNEIYLALTSKLRNLSFKSGVKRVVSNTKIDFIIKRVFCIQKDDRKGEPD